MIRFLDIKRITDSFQPDLDNALKAVVASGVFIRGAECRTFERNYATYIGTQHCVGVGNGYDALRLVLKAWKILGDWKEGDEVIVPANTYIASILAVTDNHLKPVLVEPDPATFNIAPSLIRDKITSRTRAVLFVHLYGRNATNETVINLCRQYELKILEDNAQAAGCRWNDRRTGSLGHAAAHSFFPTKNLGALGDGGAVTTDDGELAEMVRTLGNYGSPEKGVNTLQGVNSRLDELQAAVLNLKLSRLDQDNESRRRIALYYRENIHNAAITIPEFPEAPQEHVWHLFVVRSKSRDQLKKYLREAGVETLVHYPVPPHRQQALASLDQTALPATEMIHREVLSLPLYPVMEKDEMARVVEAVSEFRSEI